MPVSSHGINYSPDPISVPFFDSFIPLRFRDKLSGSSYLIHAQDMTVGHDFHQQQRNGSDISLRCGSRSCSKSSGRSGRGGDTHRQHLCNAFRQWSASASRDWYLQVTFTIQMIVSYNTTLGSGAWLTGSQPKQQAAKQADGISKASINNTRRICEQAHNSMTIRLLLCYGYSLFVCRKSESRQNGI